MADNSNADETTPGAAGPGTTIVCPVCSGAGNVGVTDYTGTGTPHPMGDGDGDGDDIPFYPLAPAAVAAQEGFYPYAEGVNDADFSGSTGTPTYMPMGSASKPTPRENLVRARFSGSSTAPSVLLRDALPLPDGGSAGTVLCGYLSTFGDTYEIDSLWEGRFLERVAPGAFLRTMLNDKGSMRCLFDHGFDPQLGNKPLGPVTVLREDAIGAYYEVPLLDTDYNRDFVLPALRGQLMDGTQVGSQLGSSFRFMVTGEDWDRSAKRSDTNPEGLPVRTITEVQMFEFGPVTFPANDSATSGVRSESDAFVSRLRRDPLALARFTERTSYKVVERILTSVPMTSDTDTAENRNTAGDAHAVRVQMLKRRARALLTL